VISKTRKRENFLFLMAFIAGDVGMAGGMNHCRIKHQTLLLFIMMRDLLCVQLVPSESRIFDDVRSFR
jgi:uncharacterized membrane protein YsdA (DUF1294 family)